MSRKVIYKMSIKILQPCLVPNSTFKEFPEFSPSSTVQLLKLWLQNLIKSNLSTVTFCFDLNDRNKTFLSENANLIFRYVTYIILTRNLTHHFYIPNLHPKLAHCNNFLRKILYKHMYKQFYRFF